MKDFKEFKEDLQQDKTMDLVNSTTAKEKSGSLTNKSGNNSNTNKSTIKTKGSNDEVGKVNSITKSNSSSAKKAKGSDGANKSTIKTKGKGDESGKVNSITKANTNENYQDYKTSLTEAKDRLKKSKEICNAIKAQTDNKEIITMADGIIADIDKGELTPKQSEWIYNTSTSFKK